jgi:hypothetical protein
VLIEVEQRRVVGRQERCTNRVFAGRDLRPHAHRRAAASAEERFRTLLTAAEERRKRGALSALPGLCVLTRLTVGPPPPHTRACATAGLARTVRRSVRPPPFQFMIPARSLSIRISSRSQGTEPKPVGDMLSPKIGVTVIVYSPSEGNVWLTQQAAARAEGQSFDVVILR